MKHYMKWGTTFSQRVLQERHQDTEKALADVSEFAFELLRIGAHWDECEPSRGVYDFEALKSTLKQCQSSHQNVLLTIGVKAPRWPEFYFPAWISAQESVEYEAELLAFVRRVVDEMRHFSCIVGWQVENEPLDPSGPENRVVPLSLLEKEIAIVRGMDDRPIWVTLWGNDVGRRNLFPQLSAMSDTIGLDLYPKQHVLTTFMGSIYRGPLDSDTRLKAIIDKSAQPVWLAELQAEPWEKDDQGYWSQTPKSLSPEQLQKNIQWGKSLGPEGILLWGYEFWWQKREQGDPRWWDVVQAAVKKV